jgi:subtilisin family serine protease
VIKYRRLLYGLALSGLIILLLGGKFSPAGQLFNDRAAAIVGAQAVSALQLVPGNLDGSGQLIGIADSGLDRGSTLYLHEDLRTEPGRVPRVAFLRSYSDRTVPDDPVGHGTHMAATLVGSGAASDGRYQGLAPGASLYFQALLDADGQMAVPQDVAELFSPAYEAGVRLQVNGWGREINRYSQYTAEVDAFVYRYPDFLPIFGAGNLGPSTGSLSAEGNSKNALVIGSSEVPRPTFSAEASSATRVAASSSRGPAADGRIKPDLLAPGSAVISAASSLIRSNFIANPQYTRLGGTSMAAAVTGGSAALLAQYLQEKDSAYLPSAALYKALLINGADRVSNETYSYGFGILNLAQTILPLQTGLTHYEDQARLLQQDQTSRHTFTVSNSAFPVKATLTWTDPASLTGAATALVNDLDLTVTAPDGTIYYGNDLNRLGIIDRRNNVEQILIEHPLEGQYQVEVTAARISEAYWRQDFALVYGQILRQETITAVSGRQITLSGGDSLDLNRYRTQFFLRGESVVLTTLQPGYQICYSPEQAFIFGDFWNEGGVQILSDEQGTMVVEMNPEVRSGGYYIDSTWLEEVRGRLPYNETTAPAAEVPYGVGVDAVVNPFSQMLWGLKTKGILVEGYIETIDAAGLTLRLLQDETVYQLTLSTATTYVNNRTDANPESEPFGYFEAPSWKTLLPGIQVSLMINPVTDEILHISARRETVLGRVVEINPPERRIELDNGKTYLLFSGARLERQGETIEPADLQPGDWLGGILLRDTDSILAAEVIEAINWGRIIYFSERLSQLYILDQSNRLQLLTLEPQALIMQEGVVRDRRSLQAGQWVRIFSGTNSGKVYRVDIAEVMEEGEGVVLRYAPAEQRLYLGGGKVLPLAPATLCVRQGLIITQEDLQPGDLVQFTSLWIPGENRGYTVRLETGGGTGEAPELSVQVNYLNGALVVTGFTSAEQVWVYHEEGEREALAISADGSFGQVFLGRSQEKTLTVLAVSPGRGAKVMTAPITAYLSNLSADSFLDTVLSPYAQEIEFLRTREVIAGYGDRIFRPEDTVSRLEFMTMLVHADGQAIDALDEIYYFSDFGQIPWWGLTVANAVKKNGWVSGFPDQTFRPNDALKTEDLQAILHNIEGFDFVLPAFKGEYVRREEAARVIYLLLVSRQ